MSAFTVRIVVNVYGRILSRETTLGGGSGDLASVDLELAAGLSNAHDVTLLLEDLDGLSSQRTVHSDSLRDDRGGDQLSLRNLLGQLVPEGLVEQNSVVNLILLLTLRPLLLLSLTSGKGGLDLRLL